MVIKKCFRVLKRLVKAVIRKGISFRERLYVKWVVSTKKAKKGVNIIGFARGDFGLGEHMRLTTHAFSTTDIDFCANNSGYTGMSAENSELNHLIVNGNPFLINLFCYNPPQILDYVYSVKGLIAQKRHYNIGYGYWELTVYPNDWAKQTMYLNEIWAPTLFVRDVIAASTNKPVYHMPIPVEFEEPKGFSRSQFELPENRFVFLFTFDMGSNTNRKNPEAVIQAFAQAFPLENNDNVTLVIKCSSQAENELHAKRKEALLNRIAYDKRIVLIDKTLDRISILGLISVCDVYVSLHRSEGFGLGMAEAMKMQKVVIATNFSGNTDFMNSENSCPVDYTLINVKKDEYPYVENGAQWAEPNLNHAAHYMEKVYKDEDFYTKTAKAAKLYIEEYHSFKAIGKRYKKRVTEISNTVTV